MPYVQYDLIGSYNKQYKNIVDPQFLCNWYEIEDKDASVGKALIPWPGTRINIIFPEVSSESPIRGSFYFENDRKMYQVCGNRVFSIDITGLPIFLGMLSTSTGLVSIASNTSQVLFVDGANGHLWDGTSFNLITSEGFPTNPIFCTYFDGFLIVCEGGTNKFFISAVNDGMTWDALQFATTSSEPDILVAVTMLKRRLYLLGTKTVEIWYDAGAPVFPFARDNTQAFEFGCAAIGSVANDNEGILVWLAQTGTGAPSVKMTDGGDINTISTPEVTLAIQSYTDVSDATGFLVTINGILFYVLNFTKANVSWLYNFTYNNWSTLSMADDSRYFAQTHVYFNGIHYLGHYKKNALYALSSLYTNNDQTIIKRTRIGKIFRSPNGQNIAIKSFEIQFAQGLSANNITSEAFFTDNSGNIFTDNQGNPFYDNTYTLPIKTIENPVVYLSFSHDGENWSNEVTRPIGGIGETQIRTVWNNLGMGNIFIFKLVCFANTDLTVVGANMNYDIVRY